MANKKMLFTALLICWFAFTIDAVLTFATQPVSAGQEAEAPLVPQRIQVVEEKGFSRGSVTIIRVTYHERFDDITIEYCVVFSTNGGVTILERRVVYDKK